WAVIALPTVALMTILAVGPRRVARPAAALAVMTALATVPLLLIDAHSFVDSVKRLADLRGALSWPSDIWWGFVPDATQVPGHEPIPPLLHSMPDWLGLVARPLIVAMGLAMPLAFRRRVA